ncbi:MAG: hypothetical protein A2509_04405 [Candidatus Edwardsbacteria bacterium RIFOXYD12_FULL_50_11]|uniref:Uncharacterized protein n=1 Tax=Candidatus Edwardsbacteria bacterium GWF2_54_11 TaxID=1817851 RepID=A0A1F5RF58_9BACT|nr:MAG: hypothetical protein A2502_05610 [Candidatus Edwardsbacteria bacterium RifOxyC12_full_54_24]OGF07927.1 MAG: hypothetical protein A2273_05565 [Candidatus Edwardsbacteria bacterium RifOxyA12_full_54_48]OGF10175.1 MAG: hypothetical protein A3K15_11980 [Candidatus Edwardsbacteria bacterium GWE2_54_12]OGF13002.1 MAG: hypothetical protein A2024_01900 [Candidatus Edwardsbacteria bacterium GWF2_54_11]OGF15087.1 MAG: hypothetical protein A2509_04405 [Candidatus Edwardsbacteria bacterium RIFOXYD1
MFKLLLYDNEFLWYVTVTNLVTIAGSILLWITCVLFGLIARKYELVLRKKTDWQYMIFAPSGILVYAVIQIIAFADQVKLNVMQSWIAYTFFLLSGLLSLLGAMKFKKVVTPVKKAVPAAKPAA